MVKVKLAYILIQFWLSLDVFHTIISIKIGQHKNYL